MPYTDYTSEEVVRRGQELYEQGIRAQVEADNKGRFIVIDIETGDYLVGDDYAALADQLHARRSDAVLCALRIGYRAVGRMGGGPFGRRGRDPGHSQADA